MTRYKLHNIIKREFTTSTERVTKEKFSYSRMRQLLNSYDLVEYVQKHYCCYGEDHNCWIDEYTSWMPKWWSREQRKNYMYKNIKSIIHNLEHHYKKIIVFRQETDNYVIIIIPCRTCEKCDYYLVFKK